MTDGTNEKAPSRRRGKPIEVWVTDEEKAAITERAEEAGMSRSGYLRALGMNTPIRSVVDITAVADLAKINGDLGRVAGLLKLWLSEKPGFGASAATVEAMMVEFRELQAGVCLKMGGLPPLILKTATCWWRYSGMQISLLQGLQQGKP